MRYCTIWCSALWNLALANPISQWREKDDLYQTNSVSQFLSQDIRNPIKPDSVGGEPECTAMEYVPDYDLGESPNLVRRLEGACPKPASEEKEKPRKKIRPTTNNSERCDDPLYNVPVSCGGMEVFREQPETINVIMWVLNCQPGKFLF